MSTDCKRAPVLEWICIVARFPQRIDREILFGDGWAGWSEVYVDQAGDVVAEFRGVRPAGQTMPGDDWHRRWTRDILDELGVKLPPGIGVSTWTTRAQRLLESRGIVDTRDAPPSPCVWPRLRGCEDYLARVAQIYLRRTKPLLMTQVCALVRYAGQREAWWVALSLGITDAQAVAIGAGRDMEPAGEPTTIEAHHVILVRTEGLGLPTVSDDLDRLAVFFGEGHEWSMPDDERWRGECFIGSDVVARIQAWVERHAKSADDASLDRVTHEWTQRDVRRWSHDETFEVATSIRRGLEREGWACSLHWAGGHDIRVVASRPLIKREDGPRGPGAARSMTLLELYLAAAAPPAPLRFGQALFNVLLEVRPDLAEALRGTDRDPFHASDPRDPRVLRAAEFIEAHWREPVEPGSL